MWQKTHFYALPREQVWPLKTLRHTNEVSFQPKSKENMKNLTEYMKNDPTNGVRYLKLKYGIAVLEDTDDVIDSRTYFVTLLTTETASYVKELVRTFELTQKEKNLKSCLLIIGSQEELGVNIPRKEGEGILFAPIKDEKEIALLLYGSIAYVSLLYQEEQEQFYFEIMKLGVPLVLPEPELKDPLVGHAAFFLEKITEENVSNALMKLENSKTLRESIVKSALERIKAISAS